MTYAWKDELEKKTHKAINRAMGEISSQQSQRSGAYDHLEDEQVLLLIPLACMCINYSHYLKGLH